MGHQHQGPDVQQAEALHPERVRCVSSSGRGDDEDWRALTQAAVPLPAAGVGGGISQNGDVPATTADEAASRPFFGIFGVYNASTDPWQTAGVGD